MTHPIFRKDIFIETPFEIRFQAMLRYGVCGVTEQKSGLSSELASRAG